MLMQFVTRECRLMEMAWTNFSRASTTSRCRDGKFECVHVRECVCVCVDIMSRAVWADGEIECVSVGMVCVRECVCMCEGVCVCGGEVYVECRFTLQHCYGCTISHAMPNVVSH